MHWKSSHNQLTLKVVFFSHNHWEIPMNLLKKYHHLKLECINIIALLWMIFFLPDDNEGALDFLNQNKNKNKHYVKL